MSPVEATHGLNCPNCGGMVPVPEGQTIVACPYCEMRSFVRGERGLQRYQVPKRVERETALQALRKFLKGNFAIAGDVAQKSTLQESFLAYLPFWADWGRVMSWVFGQKQVGSGDNKRYEPREVRSVQEMTWNGVALDVGEFGVSQVSLSGRPLEPFDSDGLHANGLVFEPVGSVSDARDAAEREFEQRVRSEARLDRIAQVFIRQIQRRMGLVYYPLWVLRYLYRGRSFQVVVDGYSGDVLYGKAPGSTLYRAAMLVGGMALGALLAVDGSALAWYIAASSRGDDAEGLFVGGLVALAVGFGIMVAAYRAFRYGEHYEFRSGKKIGQSTLSSLGQLVDLDVNSMGTKDVKKWLNRLS